MCCYYFLALGLFTFGIENVDDIIVSNVDKNKSEQLNSFSVDLVK